MQTPNEDIRILFVGFDTTRGHSLQLDEEIDAIEGALADADMVGALPIRSDPRGTTDSLHSALLNAPRVQVLHFSAHGHPAWGLVMVDAEDRQVMASGTQLSKLLGRFRNLRLIVLGGCYQKRQAAALKRIFDCVLATSDEVPVDASRQFMRAFYKGLARGDSVGAAFKTAKARIAIDAPGAARQFWLERRRGLDPDWVRLDPVSGSAPTVEQIDAVDAWLRARVNSSEDIVITANATDWREAVPHAGAEPEVRVIDVPSRQGGWHRVWPPRRSEWSAAAEQIKAIAREVQAGRWKRVHLVTHLPFGLAALLTRLLEAMKYELIVYQCTPPRGDAENQRRWQPWGPGAAEAMPPPDATPFFVPPVWPARRDPDFTGEVAITVGVSGEIAPELVYAAAGESHRICLFPLLPREGAGQSSVDQRNIGRAAAQLAEALQKAGSKFPKAKAVHLFARAPQALIMRAALRLATSPVRVIVNEFFPGAEQPLYLPMVDLKDGVVIEAPRPDPSEDE